MQYYKFDPESISPFIAILIKTTSFNPNKLTEHYLDFFNVTYLTPTEFVAVDLYYHNNKCTAKQAKEYLQDLLPRLQATGIKILLVADATYFKYLTKSPKPSEMYGYACNCVISGYEDFKVIQLPNYQAILYNPNLQQKLDIALQTFSAVIQGTYTPPGCNIIHSEDYPSSPTVIRSALNYLKPYTRLTCDIETKGLKFYNCGLSTIGFAWDKHNGIAFSIDRNSRSKKIKKYLKQFLIDYPGRLIFHNATFDIKVLVYNLWMEDLSDYTGMITGLNILCKKSDDTKLMAYLCLNNTIETKLGLKVLAHEYSGNYAQEEIADTEKIELDELLRYNLVDCLNTFYLYDKFHPMLIQENQQELYKTFFRPALKSIIQMELCGMPVDIDKILQAEKILHNLVENEYKFFNNNPIIQEFHYQQLEKKAEEATKKAKKKVYTIDDPVIMCDFNPNSNLQLQELIYTYLAYEPIDFTKKKKPAVGSETLQKLINHAKCNADKEIFQHLIDLALADKILSSFIPALKQAQQLPNGSYRLYGNFVLGAVKSGRLSSNSPNLTNLPAKSKYAKLIKECFISPKGWLFVGSDFNSLEDKVNALITKDPNKLKVYTDGYDGHCLRAYSYFQDQMPDIENTIQSINSIANKYKSLRQASKAPTFALTYGGTSITLVQNCGFSQEQANQIEQRYHELYKVSDAWVDALLTQAETDGYVTGAFGLKLRTPLLAQTITGTRVTPYQAEAERRSAGNAISGQSYCMLTTRAAMEFQDRVLKSKYALDILPVAQIHDAIYLLVKDNAEVLEWVNTNLIECMAWQELPELKHDSIKLTSSLDVHYPDWSHEISISNNATEEQIIQIAKDNK